MFRKRPIAVCFFRLDSGKEPVREWLKSMRPDERKVIGEDVKTLQFGWPVGMPLARKMSNDLWELRSTLDRGIARTFFTVYGGQIILLHGFMKKAQKNTSERVGTCQAPAQQVEVLVMAKKNVGSSFDEFLEEEGLFEGATAAAVKRVIAFQLAQKMSEHSLSKSEMARRMATSRSALDRLLDPDNVSVTLQTLQSAVQALGGRLNVEIDFDDHANAA